MLGKRSTMKSSTSFKMPPELYNGDGNLRKVGFELEFTGLSITETGKSLKSALGGKLLEKSVAESLLKVEGLGSFKIELDWAYIKSKAAEEDSDNPSQWLELLSQSAALLVPTEIVCPPISLDMLDELTPMTEVLRKAGATGTEDSIIAAYGVHINTEIPRLDATTLFSYLRAYSLLQWWLVDTYDIDLARKLSPYIDLYPEAYLEQLFNSTEPTMDQLVDDYLEHNDSRNRALDMLPILAEIDADRVKDTVGDKKVQARPAFHYRLPDCHIEKPDWSLASSWASWLVVEQLACNKEALDLLSDKFLKMKRPLLGVSRSDWTDVIDQWHQDHI